MDADQTRDALASRGKSAWAEIAGAVHDKIADKVNAQKFAHVENVLETFERDLAPHIAPLLATIIADPQTPEPIRGLLQEIAEPQHLTASLGVGIAVGAIIAPILGSATAPFVQGISNTAWFDNPQIPLSPSILAESVIKGVVPIAAGTIEAMKSGIDAGNFNTMVLAAGNAIGVGEALSLWNRGLIDQAEVIKVLKYSNVNPAFYDDALKLRYAPPGAGTVIEGAVKSHLSDAEARTKLGEAGVNPDNYQWLKDSAGRPPGVQGVLELWNRKLVSEADVNQVIAQSDINPNYTDMVKLLRLYFPPPRSIVPLFKSGAYTEAQARERLADHGLQQSDIDAFIHEAQATHTNASGIKEASAAQVTRSYQEQLLSAAEATAKLTALKYTPDAIALLLDLADNARLEATRNAAITAIRSKYVAHKITRAVAQSDLATLKLPPASVGQLLPIWDLERSANVHTLTPAQIMKAYRMGAIPEHDAHVRLNQAGVTDDDISIVVVDAYTLKEAEEAMNAAISILAS